MKPVTEIRNLQHDVDAFTLAYIEAMFFTEAGPDSEEMSEKTWLDLAPEALEQIVNDCAKFQASNRLDGYPPKQAGHDFWLTRNGHGAGFWENDFGTPEQCEFLTASAKSFGECNLYVSDDGKLRL